MTEYIDIEPLWQDLCRLADRGGLPEKELMTACVIADLVRKAQKNKAKSITFFFNPENRDVEFEVTDYESDYEMEE